MEPGAGLAGVKLKDDFTHLTSMVKSGTYLQSCYLCSLQEGKYPSTRSWNG